MAAPAAPPVRTEAGKPAAAQLDADSALSARAATALRVSRAALRRPIASLAPLRLTRLAFQPAGLPFRWAGQFQALWPGRGVWRAPTPWAARVVQAVWMPPVADELPLAGQSAPVELPVWDGQITWQAAVPKAESRARHLNHPNRVRDTGKRRATDRRRAGEEPGAVVRHVAHRTSPGARQVRHVRAVVVRHTATGGGQQVVRLGNMTAVIAYARSQVGKRYVTGGLGSGGFDCSGLTKRAYAQAGINLPHSSRAQAARARTISRGQARAGDLVVGSGHVGIYMGNGMMIDAGNHRTGVIYRKLYSGLRVKRL